MLDSGAGGFTFAVKKIKWLGSLFNRTINQPFMKEKKQVPACRMGAQDRTGKAQRYGPIREVRREYGRLGLAVRTDGLVNCSEPDRQAWAKQRLQRHPFLRKKDIAKSAVPDSIGQLPKRSRKKIPNFTIIKI
jgi:hypothetical protein